MLASCLIQYDSFFRDPIFYFLPTVLIYLTSVTYQLSEYKGKHLKSSMAPLSFKVNTEYAQISELVPRLFICGVSALTQSNMKAFNITLIVNATKEVPNLKCLGEIQRMKLWIDDVPEEDLFPHFGVVTDQVNTLPNILIYGRFFVIL